MIDYGFIAPEIRPDHYVLGSSSPILGATVREDGQWDAFLPEYEPQAEGFETAGCTVWGTQNAIEALERARFGVRSNYSERFTYILSGIRPPGGDPHLVAEVIRENGMVSDQLLPMTETFGEFVKPDPMEEGLMARARAFLSRYRFRHDWVFKGDLSKDTKSALMRGALRSSPLGISVSAWKREGEVYVDGGLPNNHWCVCYGWDDSKRAWKVFDSYDHSHKLYSYGSEVTFCKRYELEAVPRRVGFWASVAAALKRIFKNK